MIVVLLILLKNIKTYYIYNIKQDGYLKNIQLYDKEFHINIIGTKMNSSKLCLKYQTKFNTIEIETLQHIKTAFENEEIIFQYQVGKYKIDLYFPIYKLAIECDEKQHNKLNELYNDNKREENIKEIIKDCIFIRYKPYDKDFNIFKLINNIYIHIISSKFKYYRYC